MTTVIKYKVKEISPFKEMLEGMKRISKELGGVRDGMRRGEYQRILDINAY